MSVPSAITVAFGLVVGALIAAPGLAAFNDGLTGSLVPEVSVAVAAALIVGYGALALIAAAIAARTALRLPPVAAIAARE